VCTVSESWHRIVVWLASNAPSIRQPISGPATEAEILATEDAIGFPFPQDLRSSYLLHNPKWCELGFFPSSPAVHGSFCLTPIEEILSNWQPWQELIDMGDFDGQTSAPDRGIRNDWWCKEWIPVAGNDAGDHICVDLSPTEEGTLGQVIAAWHASEIRSLLARSWGEYLAWIAQVMESGTVSYDENYGLVQTALLYRWSNR